MNKQLSVMGLAARASMVPVLIASGLTALALMGWMLELLLTGGKNREE